MHRVALVLCFAWLWAMVNAVAANSCDSAQPEERPQPAAEQFSKDASRLLEAGDTETQELNLAKFWVLVGTPSTPDPITLCALDMESGLGIVRPQLVHSQARWFFRFRVRESVCDYGLIVQSGLIQGGG